ncbi:hypothetical protein CPC16_006134, partial [Podila verticillata]
GAPIVKLKQNIDVLDSAGNRIGRLETDFEDAIPNGAYVSTSTTLGPLKIYDDARPSRYSEFIAGLNNATTYTLGLNGTADSILNLGDLGNITVTGIKLNVKTELAGLQGLADVNFLQTLSFQAWGETGATVLISINNPSKLTLHIGDLVLSAGLNYTDAGQAGLSTITDLKLVPGLNEVISASKFETEEGSAGKQLIDKLVMSDLDLYLKPIKGSSKNPALDAGLQELRQHLALPQYMIGNSTVKVLGVDWTLKVPDSAVEDGIAYMTVTASNPFSDQPFTVVSANSKFEKGEEISAFIVKNETTGVFLPIFEFAMPGTWSLQGKETREVSIPVKINPTAPLQFILPLLPGWIELGNRNGVIHMRTRYFPSVKVANLPRANNMDWSSAVVHGDMFGTGDPDPYMNLHVGPDFVNVQKYLEKLAAPTPTATPSVVPTTVSPVPTVVVPTPSPTVSASVPVVSASVPVPPTSATTNPSVPTSLTSPVPTSTFTA